ncbi:MAG: NAD(+) synthase [Bacteroidetes bacterium]|nr:NAD(+) synthase [Bacteroidota bacterium]
MNTRQEFPKSELPKEFSREWLNIDPEDETNRICGKLRPLVLDTLRKQGGVVGISGGIDSSVVLALIVKAVGAERVLGVLMPEKESDLDSARLAKNLADMLGVNTVTESISDALEGFSCYKRRDDAISRVIPEYHQPGWATKIVLPPDLLHQDAMNVYRLVVTSPDGNEISKRLPKDEYQQIVAASNLKQRSRMSILYYHAEARNYAVIGTANKNEHDLGFFVKWGDGGVDISPILHLYKTQIFQLAKYLNIPDEIRSRIPTTDTYPGGSTQEEFFYRVPFEILDTIWIGYEKGVNINEIANALELQTEQVSRVISDIQSKKRATNYLRMPPVELGQY